MAAKRKTTKSRPQAAPNALTLLRTDHSEVAEMFEKFEKRKDKMNAAQKDALVSEICLALTVHAQIEEEIFYPAVRPEIDDDDLMDEAEVEHDSLKELIAKIEGEGPDGDLYDAHVIVLGEYVKHHVKEEQNEMFKKVRETDIDLKELGAQLMARKEELMAEMASGGARSKAKPARGEMAAR